MSINVNAQVLIKSSPETIAQVMFNPKFDKLWIRGLRQVFPMKPGLYRLDAKIERVGDFMNRRYSSKLVVIKYEENRMVELYADEPFQMHMRYELKETPDEGTMVDITIESFGELLYNSPIPIISKNLLESIQDDLKRLKDRFE